MIPNVDVPEGVSGNWRVERFSVSEAEAAITSIQAMQHGRGYVRPGTYTCLKNRQCVVMSDTQDEKRDHLGAVERASGRVLVAGLGLGVVLNAMLLNEEVAHATVIEKSEDVLKLVAPHYEEKFGDRLTVIHADIFEWKPPKGERWDVAWFDIWNAICTDNLPEMTKLKRKFGRRAVWKGCWCEDLLRARKRRQARMAY